VFCDNFVSGLFLDSTEQPERIAWVECNSLAPRLRDYVFGSMNGRVKAIASLFFNRHRGRSAQRAAANPGGARPVLADDARE
jgi:hypothetical protein